VAAGTADGVVQIWGAVSGDELTSIRGQTGGVTALAFSRGGSNLAVGTGAGRARMVDANDGSGGRMSQTFSEAVTSVAFSPNGLLVGSGAADGSVALYSLINAADEPLVDSRLDGPVAGVAFEVNGGLLLAAGGATLRAWDVFEGSVSASAQSEGGLISAATRGPNGTELAYAGADGVVRAWNPSSGGQRVITQGSGAPLTALAFSTDGQLMATADAGGVLIWDVATGQLLAAPWVSEGEVIYSLAFSPDGRLLLSGSDPGGAIVWAVPPGAQPAAETTPSTAAPDANPAPVTVACAITAGGNVNLRGGPGTGFAIVATLSAGQSADVVGQTTGNDGMTWYRLAQDAWVRADIVNAPAACQSAPAVSP
jgi:WD40 repeat protein